MNDPKGKSLRRAAAWWLAAAVPALLAAGLVRTRAADDPPAKAEKAEKPDAAPDLALPKKVLEAEKKRVAAVKKVAPAVVAVITGGGSGVLIDDEGYALTNFHVTSSRPTMKCGLPDGVLYDAVLVGEDKVGDVALIKLLPKKEGDKFPFAKMGDSDKVKAGDWSLAMGNPFGLSTDFSPTVTFGLVSGVHRYQYPAGTLLEYTDCIQIDTSINPGNSGGPLFNMDGELIGINGRGSFEKRGRVNSGVGYAISINQIKNFMGHMRAGIDTDHASLGASVESESDDGGLSRVLVKNIIDSDARRRGIDSGDQMVSFAGRPVTTVNQYKNVLGIYPKGWRVPLVYRHEGDRKEVLVRLMGIQRAVLDDKPTGPKPGPMPPGPPRPAPSGPAAKLYKAKTGYANYYFNEQAQERVLAGLKKHGDFSGLSGDWTIFTNGKLIFGGGKDEAVTAGFNIKPSGASDGKSPKVFADIAGLDYNLEPLSTDEKTAAFTAPKGSGGFFLALYHYRQLLVQGPKGFKDGEFSHGGVEPFYPNWPDKDFAKGRVDCEVLRTKHAGVAAKWYVALEDDKERGWQKGQLVGFEVTADKDEDPCEVVLSGYKAVAGRQLPHKFEVRAGDRRWATLNVTSYNLK